MKKKPLPLVAPPPKKRKSFPYLLFACTLFCAWLVWKSLTPVIPQFAQPPRLYSNPSREDLRLTLLSAIKSSQTAIYLSMFGLSDPAILTALAKKIQNHVPTTIYYDPTGSPNIRSVLRGATIHPILQSGFMHQKILVLDDELIFMGSANFTTQSLKMHDNLVVGFRSPKIAQFLEEKMPDSSGYIRAFVGGQDVELWLLPDPKGHALADLKKKIRSAAWSLRVALFTLTHKGLTEELIRAKKRGVAVTVVIDLHSALGASASSVETLKAAGVQVLQAQGPQLLHHKFVYIDEHTLVTGSANWTQAAFTKNSDSLLTLHNLNGEQKTFMKQLWRRLQTSAKAI